MARLKDFYKDTVIKGLMDQFGYKSVMEVPRIQKIRRSSISCRT